MDYKAWTQAEQQYLMNHEPDEPHSQCAPYLRMEVPNTGSPPRNNPSITDHDDIVYQLCCKLKTTAERDQMKAELRKPLWSPAMLQGGRHDTTHCTRCVWTDTGRHSSTRYQLHENEHLGEMLKNPDLDYRCKCCNEVWMDQFQLNHHSPQVVQSYSEARGWTCLVCSLHFSTKQALDLHLCLTTESIGGCLQNVYTCCLCQRKVVASEYNISRHALAIHGRLVHCPHCEKTFNSVSDVRNHIDDAHTLHKPAKCQQCGKVFRRQSALRGHVHRVHGPKCLKCEFCGRLFAQHGSLKVHLRQHTKERPYRCRFCTASFYQSVSRKCHEASKHTRKFLFYCQQCRKGFLFKGAYLKHESKCTEICSGSDEDVTPSETSEVEDTHSD